MRDEERIERLRKLCLALPETFEKLSHGEPTWFVKKRTFAMLDNHHHGADHLAVICNAPDGVQRDLVEADPEHFFVPPYVGGAGWIGVRLDTGLGWPTIASIVAEAHAVTLAKQKRPRRR